jgi:hypothetical protein
MSRILTPNKNLFKQESNTNTESNAKLPEYKCPIHGNVKQAVIVIGTTGIDESFAHFYCTLCFDEFIGRNVSRVIPIVKEENND